MKLFKNIARTVIASACVLHIGTVQSADWIMTSGYPEDNFHTKNIQMFIDENLSYKFLVEKFELQTFSYQI